MNKSSDVNIWADDLGPIRLSALRPINDGGPSGENDDGEGEGEGEGEFDDAYNLQNVRNLVQQFRSGYNHCIFWPIYTHFKDRCEKMENKQGRYYKQLQVLSRKALKFASDYEDGVPEDELQKVAHALRSKIEIWLPFQDNGGRTHSVEPSTLARPIHTFRFLNTKTDHVERYPGDEHVCVFRSHKNVEYASHAQLIKIRNQLDATDTFYVFAGGVRPTMIRTLLCEYRTDRGFIEACDEFDKSPHVVKPLKDNPFSVYNDFIPPDFHELTESQQKQAKAYAESNSLTISCFAFNISNNKALARFINHSIHWPVASRRPKSATVNSATKSLWYLDMNYAYTQHSAVTEPLYKGFLGKITMFNKCDNTTLFDRRVVGIFHVKRFDDTLVSDHLKKFFKQWPLFINGNTYATPLLFYAYRIGFRFDVTYGCWGLPFTFEFPQKMFERDMGTFPEDVGPRHYAKYTGCTSKHSTESRISMAGDMALFRLIADQYKKDGITHVKMFVNEKDKYGTFVYTPDHILAMPQFAAFVTAYMVVNLMLQVEKFADTDDIVSLHCDALAVSKRNYPTIQDLPLTTRKLYLQEYNGDTSGILWKVEEKDYASIYSNHDMSESRPLVSNIIEKNSVFASKASLNRLRRHVERAKAPTDVGAPSQHIVPLDDLRNIDLTSVTDKELERFVIYDDFGENILHKNDTLNILATIQDTFLDTDMEIKDIEANRHAFMSSIEAPKNPLLNKNVGDNILSVFGSHNVALLGPGGSGKTTSITSNPCFVNVGFVTLMLCLSANVRKQARDEEDDMVVNVSSCEVLGMLAKTPKGNERRQNFLRYNSVIVVDELSMITMDDVLNIHELFSGKLMVIFAGDIGYQTPPIRFDRPSTGYVSNPHNEATELSLMSLGYKISTFRHSYRQLEGDPILDILNGIRDDISVHFLDVDNYGTYMRISADLASKWCVKLASISECVTNLDNVVSEMSIHDMVLTYTNTSKDDITDIVKKKRIFLDPDTGKRLFKYYVRTNRYGQSHGIQNGTILVANECPVKFRTPTIIECGQGEGEDDGEDDLPIPPPKKRRRTNQNRSVASNNPRQGNSITKSGSVRIRINGHSKKIEPIVERYCFTVHSVQGATIKKPNKLYVDLYKMSCIRVLYTALSRLQSISQLRVFINTHTRDVEANGGLVGYIYMLTSKDPSNKHFYIGHTFSSSIKGRVTTHETQYRKFMREYSQTSIIGYDEQFHKFTMPPDKEIIGRLKGWCTSFHVLHPDPKNIESRELERVVYDKNLPESEIRSRIEGLENELINRYRNNQSVNVHGVDVV